MPHEQDAARKEREAREDAALAINQALLGLPLLDRISALCCSLIVREPQSVFALSVLIEVALQLAKKMPVAEQTQIVWRLRECAEELKTRWH